MASNKLIITGKTDVGSVRQGNEDIFLVSHDIAQEEWLISNEEFTQSSQNGSIIIVADGMGGANAGEIASELAVETIKSFLQVALKGLSDDQKIINLIEQALLNAHEEVRNHSLTNPHTEGMGTTCVVCYIHNNKLYTSWVGDSRLYRFSKEGRITDHTYAVDNLEQLSDDHSLVWQDVMSGALTPEEARLSPNSNIITQSIGDPQFAPKPQSQLFPIYKGDIIIACSDGLNAMLSDREINDIVNEFEGDIALLSDKLIEASNHAGGSDNITVAICQMIDGPVYVSPFVAVEEAIPIQDVNQTKSIVEIDTAKTMKSRSLPLIIFLIMLFALIGFAGFYYYTSYQKSGPEYPINESVVAPKSDDLPPTDTSVVKTKIVGSTSIPTTAIVDKPQKPSSGVENDGTKNQEVQPAQGTPENIQKNLPSVSEEDNENPETTTSNKEESQKPTDNNPLTLSEKIENTMDTLKLLDTKCPPNGREEKKGLAYFNKRLPKVIRHAAEKESYPQASDFLKELRQAIVEMRNNCKTEE